MKESKQAMLMFMAIRDQIMATFRDHEHDMQRLLEEEPSEGDVELIRIMSDFCLSEYHLNADIKWEFGDVEENNSNSNSTTQETD